MSISSTAGKFTRDEVEAFIDRLQDDAFDASAPVASAPPPELSAAEQAMRRMPSAQPPRAGDHRPGHRLGEQRWSQSTVSLSENGTVITEVANPGGTAQLSLIGPTMIGTATYRLASVTYCMFPVVMGTVDEASIIGLAPDGVSLETRTRPIARPPAASRSHRRPSSPRPALTT